MLACIAFAASWRRSPPVGATTWRRRVAPAEMTDTPLRRGDQLHEPPLGAGCDGRGRRTASGRHAARALGMGGGGLGLGEADPPDFGVVNVAHGTLVESKRNLRTFASFDSALEAATQPIRPAAWVNCRPPVTSPTAQMQSTDVAIVSSTTTAPADHLGARR